MTTQPLHTLPPGARFRFAYEADDLGDGAPVNVLVHLGKGSATYRPVKPDAQPAQVEFTTVKGERVTFAPGRYDHRYCSLGCLVVPVEPTTTTEETQP
jgi:hypothetical protein